MFEVGPDARQQLDGAPTVTARCPASSSAARNRSRTNAVSSAMTTVLVAPAAGVILECIGRRQGNR